ncbi:MAG: hypothetical protein LBQ43_04455 [Holosporales bacterium]|jgi:hypothetical protein|nr:hypothetical protein [Holosporales bacterium]
MCGVVFQGIGTSPLPYIGSINCVVETLCSAVIEKKSLNDAKIIEGRVNSIMLGGENGFIVKSLRQLQQLTQEAVDPILEDPVERSLIDVIDNPAFITRLSDTVAFLDKDLKSELNKLVRFYGNNVHTQESLICKLKRQKRSKVNDVVAHCLMCPKGDDLKKTLMTAITTNLVSTGPVSTEEVASAIDAAFARRDHSIYTVISEIKDVKSACIERGEMKRCDKIMQFLFCILKGINSASHSSKANLAACYVGVLAILYNLSRLISLYV